MLVTTAFYATPKNEIERELLKNEHLKRFYGLAALDGGKKLLERLLLPWEDMDINNFDVTDSTLSVCHHDIIAEYCFGDGCCNLTNYIFRSKKYFVNFLPKEVLLLHKKLQKENMVHVEFPELYGNVVFRTEYAKESFEKNENFKNSKEFENVYHAFIKGKNSPLLVNVRKDTVIVRDRLEKGRVLQITKLKEDLLQVVENGKDGKVRTYEIFPNAGLLELV